MGASSRVAPYAIRKGLVPKINRGFPVGVPATGDVRSDPPRFSIT